MVIWKRVVLGVLAAVIILTAGMYLFLSLSGRRLFNEQMSSLTNRKVYVQAIGPKFPAGVVLKGLSVEGLLKAQRVRVNLEPLELLQGRIKISSVVLENPVLYLELGTDEHLRLPAQAVTSTEKAVTDRSAAFGGPSGHPEKKRNVFLIHDLTIIDGTVTLKDAAGARQWSASRVEGVVQDLPLTGDPVRTGFALKGSLAGVRLPFIGHSLETGGWVNLAARDMDATATVRDDDGALGLEARLVAQTNDLQVSGHVRMKPASPKKAGKTKTGAVDDMVMGILGALTSNIEADFSFRTAMDQIRLGEIAFKGTATTGLSSGEAVGTAVDEIRAVGEELLQKDKPAGK